MRNYLLATICMLCLLPTAHAQGDKEFTLVVARRSSLVQARLVDQEVYVNDTFLGKVPNGSRREFRVPVNETGKYRLRVKIWASLFGGDTFDFSAAPGDDVVVDCGHSVALDRDGDTVFGVQVYPRKNAQLLVVPPTGGVTLTINGQDYRVDRQQEISLAERTTTRRCLRLDVRANRLGKDGESFLVFARPGKTCFLDLSDWALIPAHKSLAQSTQFAMQLRNCVLYHLGQNHADFGAAVENLEKDLALLRSDSVAPEWLEFRDAHVAYFRAVHRAANDSTLGIAARNLLIAAVQCGVEAMITQSAPTRMDLLGASLGAVLETAYDRYSLSQELSALNKEFTQKETQLFSTLKQGLREHLSQHELAQELLLGESLLGCFAFQAAINDASKMEGYSYLFGFDGKLRQLAQGDSASEGTYEIGRDGLSIHWNEGTIEKATISWLDGNRFNYTIVEHSSDPKQVGASLVFTRITLSDTEKAVGSGLVDLRNNTGLAEVGFALRWKLATGKWSEWTQYTLNTSQTYYCSGAFACQIRLATDGTGKVIRNYDLPIGYAATTDFTMPVLGGRKYVFTSEADGVDLKID